MHTDVRWEMLERVELSIQLHCCMWTLQILMNDVKRLVYNQDAMVILCQLAQLLLNSLYGVQSNSGVPLHLRGHVELVGHVPLHPEKECILRVAPVQE